MLRFIIGLLILQWWSQNVSDVTFDLESYTAVTNQRANNTSLQFKNAKKEKRFVMFRVAVVSVLGCSSSATSIFSGRNQLRCGSVFHPQPHVFIFSC